MNININYIFVSLIHNIDIPSGEAVGPLDDLDHEDGVTEVYEGEWLDRDDCSHSLRHHVRSNFL